MNEIILKPCPFCGWEKIRMIEDKSRKKINKGWKYTYCWCRVCGTRGPWAYNVDDDEETVIKKCAERWNERDGIQGMKKEHYEKFLENNDPS